VRQVSPVATTLTSPPGSTTNTRPAAAHRFHWPNALIRSNPDQGTTTDPSTARAATASFTNRRHWL
jgi:hypothetical protein